MSRSKQLEAEPLPPPLGRHRPAQDPGAVPVDARRDRACDLAVDDRDESGLARGDRRQDVREREGERRPGVPVLPEPHGLLEMRVVEIAEDGLGALHLRGFRQLHRGVVSR